MMNTPSEIEIELGLEPGSLTVSSDERGNPVAKLADGTVVETSCTLWALRAACTRRSLNDAVAAGIAALPEAQRAVAEARWNFPGERFLRSSVFMRQLRGWIGYNQRQMDGLLSQASVIEAAR